MQRILSSDARAHVGQEIFLQGWVHQFRSLGGILFLILRDREGILQAVVEQREIAPDGLESESVVSIRGVARADERAPGGVEVAASEIQVLSRPHARPPLEINKRLDYTKIGLETMLSNRPLSLRNLEIRSVFKVQEEIVSAFRTFLKGQGFTEIHTPKIVATGTEGGTALFAVDYFGRRAYLAQSPQFYKQMLVGAGYERVFETGPVFRAEEHNTARHINEYLSLDLEMGFIEDEQEVMDLEVQFLRFLFPYLQEACAEHLDLLGATVPEVDKVPQLRLSEAHETLRSRFGRTPTKVGDLDPEEEQLICRYTEEELDSEFVFITHYPVQKRPVYTMPDPEDPMLTRSFDLLWRGLEVTTGSQRIHDYAMLKANMIRFGLDPEEFSAYLDSFKYGMPPHGGLAIGAERMTQKLLGLKNIREACFFPRDRTRVTP